MIKFIENNPVVICILTDRKLGKKFKGIARCSEEDIFTVDKGKAIAQLKAEIKRETYKENDLCSTYKWLDNYVKNEKAQLNKRLDAVSDKKIAKVNNLNIILHSYFA